MATAKGPLVFETVFARYEQTDEIGQGGAGVVYGAQDADGNRVAVKVLRHGLPSKHAKRFRNELEFLTKNEHKNVIAVLGSGVVTTGDGTHPFYVMPRMDCSLRTALDSKRDGDLNLNLFSQLLDGLEAAHLRGVFHRDLKPENVLCSADRKLLCVADFGVANFCEDEMLTTVETKPGDRLANFAYAAPEQRRIGSRVDLRADIFSAGLILNELFTGELALGTGFKRIGEVARDLGFLDQVVDVMLANNPDARPESVEAAKQMIRRHRTEAMDLQRLSDMNNRVVKVSDIDDPLALEEVRVVGGRWDGGVLSLELSRPVNQRWHDALGRSARSYLIGTGPREMRFTGKTAVVQCREGEVQKVIDQFKSWLADARSNYETRLRSELEAVAAREREQLERERKIEETRTRVNKDLKF